MKRWDFQPTTTRFMRRRAFRTRDHIYFRVLGSDEFLCRLNCDRIWRVRTWPLSWRGTSIVGFPIEKAYEAMAEMRRHRMVVLPIGHRSRNLNASGITMNVKAPFGWADMTSEEKADFFAYHSKTADLGT